MTPDELLTRLSSELALLKNRCERVGQDMATAARELSAGGSLPTVGLIDELDVVRSQFVDLRRTALELAASAGRPATPEVTTLSALEDVIRAAREALEREAAMRIRQQALTILERLQHIRHRDTAAFPPLEHCQALARPLSDALSSIDWPTPLPDELSQLAEGVHPLAHLVEFAEHQADLDDARWEFLHDSLSGAFGRPLAVAAARGKLWVAGESTAAPAVLDAQATHVRAAPIADEDDWPTFTLAPPQPDQLPDEPQAVVSREALVWHALVRNRPGVAFLAATYAPDDDDSGPAPSVPKWLARALALSAHVRHVNGNLALQLTEDFASANDVELNSAHTIGADRERALQLLRLACALRPALVAPDTGAWTILRAVPDDSSLPALHRYARLVADHGERHPPIPPHMLGSPLFLFPTPAAWRDALEDLLREIGAWRVRFLGMRSTFPPATEVWRRWLRPDGLVHALLAPLTLDHRGLENARGLVERLSNDTQIYWEIGDTDRRLLGRVHGPDIATRPDDAGPLADRVHEAVAFARRWIALQENRPGRPDDEPRRLARALQEQLAELRPAIGRELAGLDASTSELPIRAATAQCLAAVASVDSLLGTADGSDREAGWRPFEEPSPGQLLYGDLLHVAGVELDTAWRVVRLDPALLARGLHKLAMADSPFDWRDAFGLHLRDHDNLATAQVIQCVELADPELAAELRRLRADDLEHARAQLRQDVEHTRDVVDLAALRGRLGDVDRARLTMSVESVGLSASSITRFRPQRERLHQVREQVQERVRDETHVSESGAGWRDAAALLREQLGSLEPESEHVLARALSLANYEQASISRLAAVLQHHVAGPTLTTAALEEVVSTREGARALTAGLEAALREDPRQTVVAYCLALAAWSHHLESAEAEPGMEGVTRDWLWEQANLWWEPGFREDSADGSFDNLLAEMVTAGVLRRLAPERFMLGNPNLIALLGTQEELTLRLFEYAAAEDSRSTLGAGTH